MSELSAIMEKVLRFGKRSSETEEAYGNSPEVQSAVARGASLGKRVGAGPILGTEPKVRVMVEGADRARIDEYARNIGEVFQRELGEG